jgi:site-specific DNA recombinase
LNSLRAAVYARYSSDRQSPESIPDQIRKCRQYAEAHGWEVLDAHIYSDAAVSGTISDRVGLKQLLALAESKPRPFDAILVDDSSRLSRKLSDALSFSDRLKFVGVRLVFVGQGFDSDSEQSDILMAVHGITDSTYIKELSKKTHRGLEGKALRSLHTGGRIFGYRSAPIADPERKDAYGRALVSGVRLEVDPEQAKVVRRIFSLYSSGLSIKSVTKRLNAEHVTSPQPRADRQRSWAPSSVRCILRNLRYRGQVNWGRTRKVRDPQSGRRVNRHKPESQWVRVEIPEQRIVSERLWRAVEARLAFVNEKFGDAGRKGGLLRGRAAYSPYLFSGLLKCGTCGSNFVVVSGVGRNHSTAQYGCGARSNRGTCGNDRRVSRHVLETELLRKIQSDILSPAAIDFCLDHLETQIRKSMGNVALDLAHARKRKARLEVELENLTRLAADGVDSVSLRKGIAEREAEIARLTARTLGNGKNSLSTEIKNLRKFVLSSLGEMRSLLSENSNVMALRMEMAKHIDRIEVLPEGDGVVRYKGKWRLLGGGECAEGQNRTAYAGLFRAALYR